MDLATLIIVAFAAMFFKHFVIDFPLQTPYQYLNKGTYGHLGGIAHAAFHSVGSLITLAIVLGLYRLDMIFVLCVLEGIIHYHIDWAKMYINKRMDWKCNESPHFWLAMGFDQFLHYLTYALMLLVYFRLA
jgi:hypothetical protein